MSLLLLSAAISTAALQTPSYKAEFQSNRLPRPSDLGSTCQITQAGFGDGTVLSGKNVPILQQGKKTLSY